MLNHLCRPFFFCVSALWPYCPSIVFNALVGPLIKHFAYNTYQRQTLNATRNGWKSVEHRFYNCLLTQQGWHNCCQHHLATLCQKKESRSRGTFFPWCKVCWINPCARHLNGSIAFGSFWEAISCRPFGANGMIWFSTICTGPFEKTRQVIWDAM